ncbi:MULTISPECIES: ferrochelatase [unclassified Bosea (in: a-proteobacteria)]|uniref:ferrochelatase n=1 Tax=unclassified Bosea (in: a-proteobacteria) TaxID=2653178 RepID=UPI000953E59C|nr:MULTISPECIES: ferrochelatase [unclassified Bosea (in: a-proteobacteria)]TAJ27115.1 MAG: ferrochelatase [Bosea sp. (in: a-proteobacteria)]SIR01485.1 ferrochelatase [Bosea sp. TND4EK4]
MTVDIATLAKPASLPPDHPKIRHGRIGVLLMNLGTPEGTSYWPMRAYLKEFLSDKRVIEEPRWKWWPILNLIILSVRPSRKGKDYASIWNNERNEGPLKTITRSQAEQVAERLKPLAGDRVVVDWAMRYGFPDTRSRIQALLEQGCDRILLVPLYPQYAAATSATACDQAFRALMQMRWQPAVRVAAPYYEDPAYIGALARSMRASLAKLDFDPEVILCSFHGMPKEYLLKGDPYYCQCAKTWRLLREELGFSPERFPLTFQSRFGPDEWLQPYTDKSVEALAKAGRKSMAIVAPGFSADCLETLEELDGENREIFLHNGGEKFAYLPCLNASTEGIDAITAVVERELMGWL